MAFKLNAGRGMMPKTGRGIPPTLMCESPVKQSYSVKAETTTKKKPTPKAPTEIELTKKFDDGKEKMKKAINSPGKVAETEATQGIVVDPTTGTAKAKDYEKKLTKQGDYLTMSDGSGKTIKSVTWSKMSPTGGREAEALTKEYNRQKTYTDTSRKKNETQYNITSGSKSTNDATEEEKQILVNTGKAVTVAKQMRKTKKMKK